MKIKAINQIYQIKEKTCKTMNFSMLKVENMNIKTINQEHQIEIMKIKIVNYLLTLKVENMNIKTINQNIKLSSWKLRPLTKITKLKSWGQNHQPRPSNKKEDVQIYEFSLLNVKNMSIKTINWIHQFLKKRIKIVNC
jgi:hypothetical protein